MKGLDYGGRKSSAFFGDFSTIVGHLGKVLR